MVLPILRPNEYSIAVAAAVAATAAGVECSSHERDSLALLDFSPDIVCYNRRIAGMMTKGSARAWSIAILIEMYLLWLCLSIPVCVCVRVCVHARTRHVVRTHNTTFRYRSFWSTANQCPWLPKTWTRTGSDRILSGLAQTDNAFVWHPVPTGTWPYCNMRQSSNWIKHQNRQKVYGKCTASDDYGQIKMTVRHMYRQQTTWWHCQLNLSLGQHFFNVNSGRVCKTCSPCISGMDYNLLMRFSPKHISFATLGVVKLKSGLTIWRSAHRMYGFHDTNEISANFQCKRSF